MTKSQQNQLNTGLGVEVIRKYLQVLPAVPGVYRMINQEHVVLYVGKAKNLKKRVSNYTNLNRQSIRIRRMISQTQSMEFVTTHTEGEALLLEANLIKKFAPRYNILLRDDKSFPYILIATDHEFPQVLKYRGARKRLGEYFGPFASVGSVNQTLNVLERAFLLRSCTDSVFANRTRPCLLYQIKRCSGPCVGKTDKSYYAELVDQARNFLSGGSQKIQKMMAEEMQRLSDNLQFEQASVIRDRIRAITNIQSRQDIFAPGVGEADIVAVHKTAGRTCVQVFFVRSGNNYGNRAYFPRHSSDEKVEEIINAFLGQFYANKIPPSLILLSHNVTEKKILEEALAERAGKKVNLHVPIRGSKRKLVNFAQENAKKAIRRKLLESTSHREALEKLSKCFSLKRIPERIEVFDNSHISGTNAVGAMIVSGPDGFVKNAYRKFNIRNVGADPGRSSNDDYAMMREVISRRFMRAQKEDPKRSKGQWPDLILIDGGIGHLGITMEVFQELGILDLSVAAIAKGPKRNAGQERIYLSGHPSFTLDSGDPVLYFIQRLRDEAHRFAIGTHRVRRSISLVRSPLDEIQGVGAARKRALLHHFGSARAVSQAGLPDLEAVEGINKSIATRIYDWFHPEE